jgi:excinuclease ABC subunit A
MFSFNNPFGACPKCTGLGVFLKIDEAKIIPDPDKSISQNGIKGSGWAMEGSQIAAMYMEALARRYKFSLTEPIRNIPDDVIDKINMEIEKRNHRA